MKTFICFLVIAVVKGFPYPAHSLTKEPELPIPQEMLRDALPPVTDSESENLVNFLQIKDINQPQEQRGSLNTEVQEDDELNIAEIEELNDDILAAIKLAAALRFDVLRNFALNDDEANIANEIEDWNDTTVSDCGRNPKKDADSDIDDPIHIKLVNNGVE